MASIFVKMNPEAKENQIVEVSFNCLLLWSTFYLFLFAGMSLSPCIAFCRDVYMSEKLDLVVFCVHFA